MRVGCRCGAVMLELSGPPIVTVECCCTSCRRGAEIIEALPGAPKVRAASGAVPYVMQRKDRMRFVTGSEHLTEFRLVPGSKTRRVVASCCNTAVFTEFQGGHWLSLYGILWPESARPKPQLRTMAADLPDGTHLPSDVPNASKHTIGFIWKLLWAWAAIGFRSPKVAVGGQLDISGRS